MLDPASEQIQHAAKQRERIYDDQVYYYPSRPPKNVPEWAYVSSPIYETDETEYEGYNDGSVSES